MNLAQLIEGLDVSWLGNTRAHDPARVRVCDLTEDSRTVVPGSLFVARAGLKSDGNTYVKNALDAGAVAILTDSRELSGDLALAHRAGLAVLSASDVPRVTALAAERFYGSPSSSLQLSLVTGTNGKTTVSSLVHQLMNAAGRRTGLIGTVAIDDGSEVAPAAMTTPPSIELSRSLSLMVESGCVAASLEASSHALAQKRLDALAIRVAIFTNLTGDHLDYHKTMDEYAASKARLFSLLAPSARAIVNMEDPAWTRMVRACKAPVWRCSTVPQGSPDCLAETLRTDLDSTRLRLLGPWGKIEASVPLLGPYNAMNVLQATAAAHAMGLVDEDLARGLTHLKPPAGRLERVAHDPFSVFVDYAHSDDSLRNVLAALRPLVKGRLLVVFGCGGDRDKTKRPRMGKVAAQLADLCVVTSDNPRHESPGSIIDEILAGVPREAREKVSVQADRARAIRHALELARPGDLVLIAGKGHETEQLLPDGRGGIQRVHFDDREVARAALLDFRRDHPEPKPDTQSSRKPAPRAVKRKPTSKPSAKPAPKPLPKPKKKAKPAARAAAPATRRASLRATTRWGRAKGRSR